jgi:hypothetical protein
MNEKKQLWKNRKTGEICSVGQIQRKHDKYINSEEFAKNNYNYEEFPHYVDEHYIPTKSKITTYQRKRK